MLTSVAFVVCHVRVVGSPWLTVFGLADSDAVGDAIDGGGAGGGGAAFFPHAPNSMSAASAAARPHILDWWFTKILQVFCAPELWRAVCGIAVERTLSRP